MYIKDFAFDRRHATRLFAATLLATSIALAGCAAGSSAGLNGLSSAAVSVGGIVHGGQQPVSGSHIALFATASSGTGSSAYGSAATLLASTSTDSNGNFSITTSYTCPSTQQAYLVATGGNPGSTAGTDNSAIFLVAALGPCSGIGSGTLVDINEVTTVAAAYALSGFFPAGGAGMTEAAVIGTSVGGTMPGATTSSTNTQGLSDAFANAGNIVNVATGLAYTVPPSNSLGVVPQSTIHYLADVLQICVNVTDPKYGQCPTLLGYAKPPTGSAITATPANVFQAALDIAQYPGNNVANIFNLVSQNAAFATSLTSAPNDWTIGVTYNYSSTTALKSGLGLGIDNYDNVYVTGSTAASTGTDLLEMSPQGALVSSSLMSSVATSNTIRWIAFDTANNAYMSNKATSIYKLPYTPGANPPTTGSFGTVSTLSYSAVSGTANNYALAVDKLGDVWVDGYKQDTCSGTPGTAVTLSCSMVEFPVSAQSTPVVSFGTGAYQDVQPGVGGAREVAFDVKTGNIWTVDNDYGNLTLFNVTPSSTGPATASANPSSIALSSADSAANNPAPGNTYGAVGVAIDGSSNAWAVVTGTGSTTTTIPAGLYKVTTALSPTAIANPSTGGLTSPGIPAIDGNGNIFIANNSSNTGIGNVGAIVEYSPSFNSNVGAYLSPGYGYSPSSFYTGAGAGATATATLSGTTVASITVASGNGGSGYVTPPGVVITSSTGSGATATATVSGGVVTGITVTNPGTGYATVPTVTIGTLYGGSLYEPTYVAIDRSGAVWSLSSGSGGATSLANLVQILGVAAPTDPVQANGNYGVKP